MKDFYIVESSGRGYIPDGPDCHAVDSSTIIQAAVIQDKKKSFPEYWRSIPSSLEGTQLVFFELSFDPLARIKRGKFYSLYKCSQPSCLYEYDGSRTRLRIGGGSTSVPVRAYRFESYEPSRTFDIKETRVFFGNERSRSKWRVLAIDPIVGNEEVYVLQEVSGVGTVPNLVNSKIPSEFFLEIEREYQALLAELHSSPESIVEHCRDVAISILTALSGSDEGRKDLGKLIKHLDDKYVVPKQCAGVINRFHPRRKPNERARLNLRYLTPTDADFAVQCIFQIIREVGWAE